MKKIKSITINGKTFCADMDSKSIITISEGSLFVDGATIGSFPAGDSLNIDTGDGVELPGILELYAKEAMGAMIMKGSFHAAADDDLSNSCIKTMRIARAMVEAKKYFTESDQHGKD